MIRIDSIWLATEPMDMRAGTETALAWVIRCGAAALCLSVCQPPRQSDESAGARRVGYLAGSAPPASRQVLLAGFSTRLSDRIGCRTATCPGAGFALAKSRAWQRDFHRITPAMATQAVQLSDEPIVGFSLLWQNRRHDFTAQSRPTKP